MSAPLPGPILWTAADAARAVGGRATADWCASGVSIDSRSLAPGDLFVALRGERHDAHDFLVEAFARGAAAAMVERRPGGVAPQAPLLQVADTLLGLAELGRAGRRRSRARICGLTGSVGKTGTKEALRHVLGLQAPTHASAASHNNQWGVPLSLARLPPACAYAVLELGMNHPGEIGPLARMVRPQVALVTTIAPAHLAFFPDGLAGIARAKAEIFEGLEPGGVAVLPGDSAQLPLLEAAARAARAGRIVTFGSGAGADWRLVDASLAPDGSRVVATHRGRTLRWRLGAPGRHWVMNSLAVLAAVEALDADLVRAAEALASFTAPAGRGRRRTLALPGGTALLLDESYNANPASMAAAIAVLGQQPGRRVAVLGDMLELGDGAAALHADLAPALLEAGVALVLTCGPAMAHLHAALPPERRGAHRSDSAALASAVLAELRPGDVILVKGSLGSRMARIVQALETLETDAARA